MTSTELRLRQAATRLRTLLVAIATESPADLPLHADGRTITQGRTGLLPYAEAETPEVAAFITAMGPGVGAAIVGVLEQAAGHSRSSYPCCNPAPCTATAPALALADAILGTPAGVSGAE